MIVSYIPTPSLPGHSGFESLTERGIKVWPERYVHNAKKQTLAVI